MEPILGSSGRVLHDGPRTPAGAPPCLSVPISTNVAVFQDFLRLVLSFFFIIISKIVCTIVPGLVAPASLNFCSSVSCFKTYDRIFRYFGTDNKKLKIMIHLFSVWKRNILSFCLERLVTKTHLKSTTRFSARV